MNWAGLEEDSASRSWRIWILFLIFALLLHAMLFLIPASFWPVGMITPPAPRVALQNVDPRKLEAIRKQWKKQARQQALLLDKNPKATKDATIPDNARYMSDRNINVEREQRARQTQVIPKPPSQAQEERKAQRQQLAEPKPPSDILQPKHRSILSSLGVPIRMPMANASRMERPEPRRNSSSASHQRAAEAGGDQALSDRDLPEGAENMLNAQESVYYTFYARLYETIGPIWESNIRRVPRVRAIPPGNYSTIVDVVFDSSGKLVDVHTTQNSGIAEFDAAVPDAWRKVGNFPNPPHDLLDKMGQVHTGWTFTVQIGGRGIGVDYLPPERNY